MTLLRIGKAVVDVDEALRELDRLDCEESLATFLKVGWKYIDPAPFIDGWVIDAIAEHLQAVCDGEIRKLLVNLPPRSLKSTLCSTTFPAWVWAQRYKSHTSGPGVKFLHGSYADKLSLRDSVRCRRLIESPWYQGLWGERFKLSGDQNAKHRFSNNLGGERLITSIGAGVTGEGYDIGVIDDANASNEVESEAAIGEVLEWWDGTMSTRANDPKQSALIVIQQRLAENDLSGHILSKPEHGFTHLCLPMEYDSERSFETVIGWEDPRTEEGELLWLERFGPKEVSDLKAALGPWRASGQLQQLPQPKGGGIIKRSWWLNWKEDAFPPMSYIIGFLDTAYTVKTENDYSALTLWGVFRHDTVIQPSKDGERTYNELAPKVMLIGAWKERLELHDLVEKVAKSCYRGSGKTQPIDRLLIENKAAGASVAQEIRRLYGAEDFAVQLVDPGAQDKLARLYSVQHLFSEGMVFAPDKDWAEMVITEVEVFPKGRHDDLTDTVSGALRHLRDLGLLQRPPEMRSEIEDAMRYENNRPLQRLYPA